MAEMENNGHTKSMSDILEDILFKNADPTGEQINQLIERTYSDYKKSLKDKRNVEKHIYHRDLLAYLIKTYGH